MVVDDDEKNKIKIKPVFQKDRLYFYGIILEINS
jgi:hypothetical protein